MRMNFCNARIFFDAIESRQIIEPYLFHFHTKRRSVVPGVTDPAL
jgi:hypothetical protein